MFKKLYGIFHPLKNLYLRYKNGAGCCDVWSLDYYLAKKILPALKEFKKRNYSYPSNLKTEEWDEVLDKMIWSFDSYNNKDFKLEFDEDWNKKRQEGFELFGKYFTSLWI